MDALHQYLKITILLVDAVDAAGGADGVKLFRRGLLGRLAGNKDYAQDFVVRVGDGADSVGPVLGRHEQGDRLTGKKGTGRHWQEVDDAWQDILGAGRHRGLPFLFWPKGLQYRGGIFSILVVAHM